MQLSYPINGAPAANVVGVIASDSAVIFPDNLAQTLGYDGSGNLTTITVVAPAIPGTTYVGGEYVQTLSYTSGKLTGVSRWIKQ